jgi:hypothetical protein
MKEAARTSETSVNLDQPTRRYKPEDGHLLTCRYLKRNFVLTMIVDRNWNVAVETKELL